jgi:hypothetical protein
MDEIFSQLFAEVPSALERTICAMPQGFPPGLSESIVAGVNKRHRLLLQVKPV